MTKPTLISSQIKMNGIDMYKLVISFSGRPDRDVYADLENIAIRYELSPNGGCFNVNAINLDGTHENYLGGMYVQSAKYSGVYKNLLELGYKIESKK